MKLFQKILQVQPSLVSLGSVLASTVLACLSALPAFADNHKFEVQLGAGREFFEESKKDATLINLGLGYAVNKNWTLEAVGTDFGTSLTNGGGDVDGRQYRLDALYNIDTTSLWRPFVAFGVGDQKLSFKNAGTSTRDTLANLGVGVKRSLGENWEFRTDLRAFNSLDHNYTDLAVNAGISYLFGSEPVRAKPVAVAATPVPQPKPEPVKEIDTDGDGVFDSKDQCPDTAKQYRVDSVGCPMELTESVSIKLAVQFDSDKAIVKDQYLDEIGALATFMNQYANTVVTVEGHTDSQGADAYNKQLSQKRADAVKAVLISKFGITADRVTAIGYGEEKPLADNSTKEGRDSNRRVVGQVSTDVKRKQTK